MKGIAFSERERKEKRIIFKKVLSVMLSQSSQSDHIQQFAFLVLSLRHRLQNQTNHNLQETLFLLRVKQVEDNIWFH